MTRTWTLEMPFSTPPLNLNRVDHWQVKRKKIRAVRHATTRLAQQAGIPALDRMSVELHYAPRDRRTRDPLNIALTLKPIEDGLVDAGVVPDDSPRWVQPTMPVIDEPTGGRLGRCYVIVRELEAAP